MSTNFLKKLELLWAANCLGSEGNNTRYCTCQPEQKLPTSSNSIEIIFFWSSSCLLLIKSRTWVWLLLLTQCFGYLFASRNLTDCCSWWTCFPGMLCHDLSIGHVGCLSLSRIAPRVRVISAGVFPSPLCFLISTIIGIVLLSLNFGVAIGSWTTFFPYLSP